MQGRVFAGSSWEWLTPFSVATGVALVFGYGLLGAGWLIIKTEGGLRAGRAAPAGPAFSSFWRDPHRQHLDAVH